MASSGDADPHGGRGSSALHRRPAPAGVGAAGPPPLTPGEVHAPQPWPPARGEEEEPAGEGRAGSAGVGAGAEGPAERPEVEVVPQWVPRERLEKRKADRGPAVGGWGARRECGRHRSGWARARAERRGFAARVPLCLRETDLTAALPETLDKIFAASWVDRDRVVAGTKCGTLLEIDTARRAWKRIERPAVEPPREVAEALPTRATVDDCGIHAVRTNPGASLLAAGGRNPCDFAVLELPTYRHLQELVGHSDWVFACDWLTDTQLLTASRDKTVKVWDLAKRVATPNAGEECVATMAAHTAKVRDAKYSPQTGKVASLGTDGKLLLWDPHGACRVEHEVPLQHTTELICLCMDAHLVCAGSLSHLSLLDYRTRRQILHVTSMNPGLGIRSLSLRDGVMTVGGGAGTISFFDLRQQRFINVAPPGDQDPSRNRGLAADVDRCPRPAGACNLKLGKGRVHGGRLPGMGGPTPWAAQYFAVPPVLPAGQDAKHACYTHSWAPCNTKMFVAGGPLQFLLSGTYASLWTA